MRHELRVCLHLDFALSTAEAYAKYDENPTEINPHYADFVSSIVCGSLSEGAGFISNVFTKIYHDSRIEEMKTDLLESGAVISEMTGSGSVVFGVFESEETAVDAKNILSGKYPHVFMTRPVNSGVYVVER
ncbi:MAG: hypothetical protein ACLTIL_05565 [[Eubacterium] siraeum]